MKKIKIIKYITIILTIISIIIGPIVMNNKSILLQKNMWGGECSFSFPTPEAQQQCIDNLAKKMDRAEIIIKTLEIPSIIILSSTIIMSIVLIIMSKNKVELKRIRLISAFSIIFNSIILFSILILIGR